MPISKLSTSTIIFPFSADSSGSVVYEDGSQGVGVGLDLEIVFRNKDQLESTYKAIEELPGIFSTFFPIIKSLKRGCINIK